MNRPDRFPTFLGSERILARFLARPVSQFLHVEASGGILLLAATVAALVWANSPWADAYQELLTAEVNLDIGGFALHEDVLGVVNDGLMVVFFFVIGLEVKRELVVGELQQPRSAALPAAAALGGMVVPAVIYTVLNAGGEGLSGWGIPMATDIAFALGVLSLLGDRVPASLKVFLLSLAIADDIGAIAVIAVFYSEGLSFGWLGLAVLGLVVTMVMRRLRIWYIPLYVVVGTFVWLATFESGVHATIAGVALGLITPARPLQPPGETQQILGRLESEGEMEHLDAHEVRAAAFLIRESTPVAERLENALHPWTSYVVIPIFALANAGIPLSSGVVADAARSPITLGVALGLVAGKALGVSGFTLLASRLGIAILPRDVRMPHIVGLALLAGIGFTVSLFIANLAFEAGPLREQAKMGILAGSAVAAVGGTGLLAWAGRSRAEDAEGPVSG